MNKEMFIMDRLYSNSSLEYRFDFINEVRRISINERKHQTIKEYRRGIITKKEYTDKIKLLILCNIAINTYKQINRQELVKRNQKIHIAFKKRNLTSTQCKEYYKRLFARSRMSFYNSDILYQNTPW
jgi:hypothetical protein